MCKTENSPNTIHPMNAAILIIGSLRWDNRGGRDVWRKERLLAEQAIPVKAPVRYGRKSRSRGNTYTMVLAPEEKMGRALLVPLIRPVATGTDLFTEAKALWMAETNCDCVTRIHASWGSVGAWFGNGCGSDWAEGWAGHFTTQKEAIEPINKNGLMEIPWPTSNDGKAVKYDIILATATKAEAIRPSTEEVAAAWANQKDGLEAYFFENIRHGIRTPDDAEIWRKIEEHNPAWILDPTHSPAIEILRREKDIYG